MHFVPNAQPGRQAALDLRSHTVASPLPRPSVHAAVARSDSNSSAHARRSTISKEVKKEDEEDYR